MGKDLIGKLPVSPYPSGQKPLCWEKREGAKQGEKKKKKGYNKARILPRGDADSSSCRKKEEMATAALQERIRCCHRRGGFEENYNPGNRGERWIKSLSDASKSLLPSTGCTRMARGTGATAGTTATSERKRAEEKRECRGQSLAWGLGTAANSCWSMAALCWAQPRVRTALRHAAWSTCNLGLTAQTHSLRVFWWVPV